MNREPPTPNQPLQEGMDYYFEHGLMVFTREFHLRRGYCCGSGCRHCPYPKPARDDVAKEEEPRS